jgi:hypothetical protein
MFWPCILKNSVAEGPFSGLASKFVPSCRTVLLRARVFASRRKENRATFVWFLLLIAAAIVFQSDNSFVSFFS